MHQERMAGDPGVERRGADTPVTLDREQDVQYWSDRFNVTKAHLEEAISAVGNDAHAVEMYLRGQGAGD